MGEVLAANIVMAEMSFRKGAKAAIMYAGGGDLRAQPNALRRRKSEGGEAVVGSSAAYAAAGAQAVYGTASGASRARGSATDRRGDANRNSFTRGPRVTRRGLQQR